MAFDQNKYKEIFEKRYGSGSFESGLSQARQIGKTKVEADFAKQKFMDYMKEKEKERKAAEKKAQKKTYDDAVSFWNEPGNKERLLNRGVHNIENDLLNDPNAKAALKESGFNQQEFVDAMYNVASGGSQLSKRGFKQDQKKEKDTVPNSTWDNPMSIIPLKGAKKKSSKKKDDSLLPKVKDWFTGKDTDGDGKPNGLFKALEILDRPGDAVRTGIKEKVEGRSFLKGAKDGFLGKKDTSGKELNKALGFDPNKSKTQRFIANEGSRLALETLMPISRLATPFLNKKQEDFLGNEGSGLATEMALDPLNLVGAGAVKGVSKLKNLARPVEELQGLRRFTGNPSPEVLNSLTPSPTRPLQSSNGLYDNLILNAKQPKPLSASALNVEPNPLRSTPNPLRAGRDFEPISAAPNGRPNGMTAPDPLDDHGYGLFDTQADAPRVARELQDAQRQASGDINTFRSRVDRTPVKKENNLLKNLRTQFVDDVAPLETLEKNVAGKVGSAEDSLYKQARLFKGSPEKAHLIVQEQLQPLLKDLQSHKISTKDLGDYALAVHAKDVNEAGINSGFTNAEIEDVINKLGTPEMEAARQKLLAVNNNVLDTLKEGGILNDAQVSGMREKYPNYVSLFRSFDDDKIEFSNGVSKALANASSPIKKLEGSNRDVIDPLESVVKNIFKATNTVDRNNVGKQVAKLAEKDTEGNFIRKLDNNEDTSRLNVVSVMNDGKKEKYEVPPEVYKTLMNLDKESTNTLVKILQKPASLLRAGATLTPEFSLRNPMRDVPNAFVVSESGFNPLIDFPVGLWQSIWKGRTIKIGNKEFKTAGDLYKQFIHENGGYGNIISMDRKVHQQTLKKALTEVNAHYVDVLDPKTYTSLLNRYKNPVNVLRKVADTSETATKVGEFRAAKRSGASPQEAAYRARDIMDFGRAGVSVREANKVVAFLNANIQGKSKLLRAFKEHPVKFIGKAVTAVTLPTIAEKVAQNTYANEKQKAIIDDAPKWLKNTFWLFPIPGTNQIARIPKPFDLAFAFSNTFDRAFDFAYKHDKNAFDGFIKDGFSQASIPVMLTGIAPVIEGMANYSFFKQGSIIPKREEGIQYPDQYDINTSEVAKLAGKGINKLTGGQGSFKNFGSPRVIDNTIQGFSGGSGTYVTNFIDWMLNSTGAVDNPEKPTKSIDQQPLTRAFLVNQSGSGQSLDDLYTMKSKLTNERGSAKQNNTPFTEEGQYKFTNDVTKDISKISGQIRSIENAPNLSGDQKKKMIDELIRARNNLARQAMERLRNQE